MMKLNIRISEQRNQKVYDDLLSGSDPRQSFFLLVALSTLIAAFGLVMNSTAVVIGAMLVAPLMTPILGLALALVRGDAKFIGVALRAETIGVGVSVLAGIAVGLSLPAQFEATPEMLSRTEPNLFDLLVAVLAGLAGAYALVDEKLSPVLPGVAISTAIVPPLANCGMCIALGAYAGALGSFLLFFTNFLSILLVSAIVFYAAGMSRQLTAEAGMTYVRRFGIPMIGFIAVGVVLSAELANMFDAIRIRYQVSKTLEDSFVNLRVSELEKLIIDSDGKELVIRADVDAPRVVGPKSVSLLEKQLSEVTDRPSKLYLRTTLTHDVSARGLMSRPAEESLDGIEVSAGLDQKIDILAAAEQITREVLEKKRGMGLLNMRVVQVDEKKILLLADIYGIRHLSLDEIRELETLIRQQVIKNMRVTLWVQQQSTELTGKHGNFRSEFSLPRPASDSEAGAVDSIGEFVAQRLSETNQRIHGWSVTILEDKYYVLLELRGPKLFTDTQRRELQAELDEAVSAPVAVYVRSQIDTVLTPEGDQSFPEVLDEFRRRNRETYGMAFENVLENTR
jgi:uncharacterized hydrophobic protein (TIGR00271 family)